MKIHKYCFVLIVLSQDFYLYYFWPDFTNIKNIEPSLTLRELSDIHVNIEVLNTGLVMPTVMKRQTAEHLHLMQKIQQYHGKQKRYTIYNTFVD